MFTSFSEIDKKQSLRVLISWKGRVLVEKSNKYRDNEKIQEIYAYFCDVIHANPCLISTIRLRLYLIKVLNYKMTFKVKVRNFYSHVFSREFGISDMDREKILRSWNMRTKIEKNNRYIHTDEIREVYQHLSNILHGEVEKHNIDYIDKCEKEVEKFFESIKSLESYKLKYNQTAIDFKNINNIYKKKMFRTNKIKNSTIFFFKSTSSNRRISFIEKDAGKLKKIYSNNYLILKHKSKELGVFEYVDSAKVHNFLKFTKLKSKHHYHLFY